MRTGDAVLCARGRGAGAGEAAGACVLRGSGRRALQAGRCGPRACARALGEIGRGRVGNSGARRPGCVGPEPWSGVFLGASLTGPLRGSMTCVQEDPVNCVAGFPALSGPSSLSEPRK